VDTKKKKQCPQMLVNFFINVKIVILYSNPSKAIVVYFVAMVQCLVRLFKKKIKKVIQIVVVPPNIKK
jgi:hypothetical protein